MPFLVYAAILVATVFSVVLEWDTLVEPSAAARRAMHAIAQVHPAPSAPAAGQVAPAAPPAPGAPSPANLAPASPAPVAAEPPPVAPDQPAAAAPPQCDVDACAAAYFSFRASDCTWQPYEGPRRLCKK